MTTPVTAHEWSRIAGSLYARDVGGMIELREWDSPNAPVYSSGRYRILSKIEDAVDNVTFGGDYQGQAGSVTVQRADLDDLIKFLRALPR